MTTLDPMPASRPESHVAGKWSLIAALLAALIGGAAFSHHLTGLVAAGAGLPLPCSAIAVFDCAKNLGSAYGKVFGIPVSAFATAFFVFLLVHVLTALARAGRKTMDVASARRALFALPLLSGYLAGAAVLYFLAISIVVLHSLCLHCAVLYGIVASIIGLSYLGLCEPLRRQPAVFMRQLEGFARLAPAVAVAVCCGWTSVNWASRPGSLRDAPSESTAFVGAGAVRHPDAAIPDAAASATPITVLEFADFECPACRMAGRELERIAAEFPGRLTISYVNFPLCNACNPDVQRDLHPNACLAAKIGIVMKSLGRFDDFSRTIFASEKPVDERSLYRLVTDLGEQEADARLAVDSAETADALRRDIDLGRRLGIGATPTLVIDGEVVAGTASLARLRSTLEDAIRVASAGSPVARPKVVRSEFDGTGAVPQPLLTKDFGGGSRPSTGMIAARADEVAGETANAWVDTNGGSCLRSATSAAYADATACGSLQAALAASQPGDTVRVKAGRYGPQTITAVKASPGTTVIAEAGTTIGALATGGAWYTLRNLTVDVGSGHDPGGWESSGSDIALEQVDLHGPYVSVFIGGGADIAWIGGELGASGTTGGKRQVGCTATGDSEPITIQDASHVTFDGIRFNPQDADLAPVSCSSNGFHLEMIRIDRNTGFFKLRNSTFVSGSHEGTSQVFITTPQSGTNLPHDLVFENNFFGTTDASAGSFDVHANVTTCQGYTIAYNTLLSGIGAFQCAAVADTAWIGNVGTMTSFTPCVGTHSRNVWQDSQGFTCGTDKVVIGPRFSTSALGLGGVDGFHLLAGSPAIDAGEAAGYCTGALGARDLEGDGRPQGPACDAGADEFRGGGATANAAPVADAGPDQAITLPASASLSGSATDDGLPDPPAMLTYAWTTVSGPGTVTFTDAAAKATTVGFSQAGAYVLRLTVSDGALSDPDDIAITVNGSADIQAPTVPAGLIATVVSSSQISLAWSAATDDVGVAGYRISRGGAQIATVTAGTSYQDTVLAASTAYSYAVAAYDAAGNASAPSAARSATTLAAPPAVGPLAWWKLDDGAGTTATDASGHGNPATVSAATWTTSGKLGGALSFDGASAFARSASGAALNLGGSGTLEAWSKLSAFGTWRSVIAKGSVNDAAAHAYALEWRNDNRLVGTIGDGNSFDAVVSAPVTDTAWHHVALAWDGTTLRLYLDGQAVASAAQIITPAANPAPVLIGRYGGDVDSFAGLIDDVRLYDRALSQAQIQSDMNSTGTSLPPTLSAQPQNRTAAVGQTATFLVIAAGTAPLTYQWQENGEAIGGATGASYTTPPLTTTDDGAAFRCVIANAAGTATSAVATLTVVSDPVAAVVAINAGGPAIGSFAADGAFSGGGTYTTASAVDTSKVMRPAPQAIYRDERYGDFTYTVAGLVPMAACTVRLHFAEIYWTAAGKRRFDVAINGQRVLASFDVFTAAGGSLKAVIREFTAAADSGGRIAIAYTSIIDNATCSGIEVVTRAWATAVPGTIQAEDFDVGGEGVAYHDLDPANNGGGYRATGVDVRACTDVGGGWQVGWMGAGEWLEYTVDVASTGSYDFAARIASGASGATIRVAVDGADETGALTFSGTGGWDTWRTVGKTGVILPAGRHVLRLIVVDGALDLNYLRITLPAAPTGNG